MRERHTDQKELDTTTKETVDPADAKYSLEDLKAEWASYAQMLALDDATLENKTVVNLGAGAQHLEGSLVVNGIVTGEMFSVDPVYDLVRFPYARDFWTTDNPREAVYSLLPEKVTAKMRERSLPGTSEDIPMENESVDLVLQVNVPLEAINPGQAVTEMLRVLRKGGEIRIATIEAKNGKPSEDAEELLAILRRGQENKEFSYSLEPIGGSDSRLLLRIEKVVQ